jgi:hypothetical protein
LDTTGTQLEIDKWENINFDKSEVMAALRPTEKTSTSLSTIGHKIDYYPNKADDPEKHYLTSCDARST